MGSSTTDPRAAWLEYQTPGSEHALLARKLGAWDLTVTVFGAPGAKAFESRGTSRYGWILGGRTLENLVVGAPSGPAFEGRGYSGFDTRLRTYWFFWADSMGTGVMRGEGRAGADGASLQWTVESTEVVAGGIRRTRSVERFLSVDEWIGESYAVDSAGSGAEWVVTRFHYLRHSV